MGRRLLGLPWPALVLAVLTVALFIASGPISKLAKLSSRVGVGFVIVLVSFLVVGLILVRNAASTVAALALFNPLRDRIQRAVDRRFNRARYDTDATDAAFGARLRDAVEPETVLGELAAAAGGSLQPAHVSVWVKAT